MASHVHHGHYLHPAHSVRKPIDFYRCHGQLSRPLTVGDGHDGDKYGKEESPSRQAREEDYLAQCGVVIQHPKTHSPHEERVKNNNYINTMKHSLLYIFCQMATGVYAHQAGGDTDDIATPLDTASFNGRTVAPLVIRGIVDSTGVEKTLSGTIQEIDAQIRSLNPEFSWERFQPSTQGTQSASVRFKRQSLGQVFCHVQNLPPAPRKGIESTRDWLNNLASGLSVDAQHCTKFSCTGNTALWFCNDNLEWIKRNSIVLATHVDRILNEPGCTTSGNNDLIQGQSFDWEHYNIIINGDQCP
ncbi:hypothetical protein GGS26DRAFT_587411 [Hypomontagnella submonticulosa]|nr:hypothetical protein GGS26DRAFT_587411 [Hypomontagnella submonticulosa]